MEGGSSYGGARDVCQRHGAGEMFRRGEREARTRSDGSTYHDEKDIS